MSKFYLKGMLSERSTQEINLPEQKLVYRSPKDLYPDKGNFYSTEDIADLKESIRSLGLLQPLLIEKREDGKDYIIAGHRRQKCCVCLLDEGDERFRKIPCVYTVSTNMDVKDDDITRQIKLIQANSYRKKTGWEEMTEALRMEDLVKELRKKTEMEGKSRDIAAGLLGTSSTQIGRYRSIQTNLSDDFMTAFKRDSISLSVAAELAGLKPEYQRQAYETFQREGNISINDVKVLKARQEQENLPGQMTIEQALHPTKPQEVIAIIPVDIQIDRFFEALRKNVSTYILQNNLNMTIYMLSALYGSVGVRNGHLNYQGQKEGILFNGGSSEEQLVTWNNFSEELIRRYGKKQKQVKMASVIEEEPENNMPGLAAEAPDEKQHDFVEPTKIEEHVVEGNKTSDHAGNPTEMLPEKWPEFLKDIPVPTDAEITNYLHYQEKDLEQILEIERTESGLPHLTIVRQQMTVAGLRLLKNLIENQEE